ncbi:MAG TPA: hypothetical protein VFB54_19970 [Burkholderiales bacterium]|nr:hypothetical protein [Burkholderiales bacterium]
MSGRRAVLDALAATLQEREVVDGDEVERLVRERCGEAAKGDATPTRATGTV